MIYIIIHQLCNYVNTISMIGTYRPVRPQVAALYIIQMPYPEVHPKTMADVEPCLGQAVICSLGSGEFSSYGRII